MASSKIPVSTLPWMSALLLGASAHVGWLVHSLHDHAPPTVKVVTSAPECPAPQVVAPDAPPEPRDTPEVIADEPPPPEPAPAAESRHRPPRVPLPDLSDAIECPSEHHRIIDRAFVDTLLATPRMLARQARVVPSVSDGEQIGFKLYGIREGSLPKALGFKNGDLLTAINGSKLTSIDACMKLYTKLRRVEDVEVELMRGGETLTKEFEIR